MQPIFDLHCDLLGYLANDPQARPEDTDRIGCATPFLQAGGVRLQVMALFAATESGSSEMGLKQAEIYRSLVQGPDFTAWTELAPGAIKKLDAPIFTLTAIENASNFAEEDEDLAQSLARLEQILALCGKPLYLTLTHHGENRFGGGNLTSIGLKTDGQKLLSYLHGKGIAIDMSHTSDALSEDILAFIDQESLEIPVIASHSNFRAVQAHPRNLPDWLVQEIVQRGGLIGINFVRDFVNPDRPEALLEHIYYGLEMAGEDRLAFGADYFPADMLPPEQQHRAPFFHPEHDNAGKYPSILAQLSLSPKQIEKLAYRNLLDFIKSRY